jgi:hypothetical protein
MDDLRPRRGLHAASPTTVIRIAREMTAPPEPLAA